MKHRLTVILAGMVVLTGIARGQTISRYLICPVGSINDGSDYSISSTVGDLAVSTLCDKNEAHFLTQGFQQPSVEPDTTADPDEFVRMGPNPVVTELNVYFLFKNFNYNIDIYDLNGLRRSFYLHFDTEITGVFHIDFSNFPSGLFLVHVYSDSGELSKTFKIEKL